MPSDVPESTSPSTAVRRVQAFRGSTSRLALHPGEKRLIGILGAHLCFLPWALGTMEPWGQVISLALAIAGLVAALWPRDYTRDMIGGADPFRLVLWPRLMRFPIFWIGAALLAYVALQGLNPSWSYDHTSRAWWLVRLRDIPWLPTSIDVPFDRFNAWRQLIVYASVWLPACSIWVGLTRRRSLRILLCIIVASALALVAVLALQRVSGNHRIPWPLTALTDKDITASFIYENHAGAYLGLAAFCGIALASWYFDHGRRSLAKSTPAGVVALGALFIVGGVFFTLSRGAALTLVAALMLFAAWFYLRGRFQPVAPGTNPAITKVVTVVFFAFLLVAFHYLDFSEIYGRWDSMIVQGEHGDDVHSRVLAREAGEDMLAAHWLRGIGAGGFRHLFPQYLKRYPAIYEGGALFWEHDHCDWLEIPIELGLPGDLLVLAGAGWWLSWFIRRKVLWHPLAFPLLIGCAQTLMHAGFDFPLQCPAILGTWVAMVAMAGRWVSISEN